MVKKLEYILFGLVVIALTSCGGKGTNSGGDGLGVIPDSIIQPAKIDPTVVEDFVDNMSSPVEMAALIKNLDVAFSKKYLAPTQNIEYFTTNFEQAFNLGVYGCDLGYLNIYNKTNSVIDYISAIKTLADGINVGQFFDFTMLKRLSQNNKNLDSLMYISVRSFNDMDKYLRDNDRSNLSIAMITGIWLEGMYLATQVYKEKPHPDLKERIGEQKIILDKLMLFLMNFKSDRHFTKLIEDFETIHAEFDDVTITIEKGPTEAIEKDGMLTFVQKDVSIVDISDERVESLIKITEEVRNKLISK